MDAFYKSADDQNILDDITQKCGSINLEDRVDSGIASMTFSDIEKARIVDEQLGETSEQDSIIDEPKSITKSIYEGAESLPSDPPGPDLYELYITDPASGISELHSAILDKSTDDAIDLIECCPEAACLDFFTSEIHTALHLAVYVNLPEVVRFLIVYGANINSTDRKGNTPLHTACDLGRLGCVRMLLSPLDEEENIGFQKKIQQDVNRKNYEGLTPLHLATINDRPDVVSFLLSQPGINVDVGDSTSGRTALHHALERRHRECFKRLLKTSIDVNATTYDGCSPLHLAVGLELEQETRYLMTRGADVQVMTSDDVKVWDLARSQKIKDALQYSNLLWNQAVKQR